MAAERDDSLQAISSCLDGKNYSYWSYVMKNFLMGKKMWPFVCGMKIKPDEAGNEKYEEQLEVWMVSNAKIITWINNSVDNKIGMQLAKYETAKQVWDHLERLYKQPNYAREYQLEMDIRTLQQKDLSIQDYYSAMTSKWDELAMTEDPELRAFPKYIVKEEGQHLTQFLMGLREDFEAIRGNILHRSPKPTVDAVLNELMAEELRLKSGNMKGILPSPNESVLVAHSRPNQNQNRGQNRPDASVNECRFCHQPGHWKASCPLLINKGPRPPNHQGPRPPNHQGPRPFYYQGPRPPNYQGPRPPASNFQPRFSHPRPPLTAAAVSSPSADALIEQLQNLIQQQQQQQHQPPQAMSAAAGLSTSTSTGISPTDWVMDSGASHHMSPAVDSFVSITPSKPIDIVTAEGTSVPSVGVGPVVTHNVSLPHVYHIPKLALNLASVGKVCDTGAKVTFTSGDFNVKDLHSKRRIGTGHREGGVYIVDRLQIPHVAASSVDLSSLSQSSSDFYLWHSRLGHVSSSRLNYLISTGSLGEVKGHDISDCNGCKLAKFSALSFSKSNTVTHFPFDLIHSDVWGPSPVITKGGSRYYVSFIDDHTRYCWIFMMKRRSDFLGIYTAFRAFIKTQFSTVIKCFRCDLGGEFTSTAFRDILASDGTIYQTSCTDTPEQNGVAERKHRHIMETARSLLLSASVPSEFWGEAALTAVYLINRIPSMITSGKSPFESLFGHAPDYSSLRVFGSACYVLLPHVERSKLSSRSALCVFLGYGEGRKGYRCFDPVSHKFYVSRHVRFLERIPFFSIPSVSTSMSSSSTFLTDPFGSNIDTNPAGIDLDTHDAATPPDSPAPPPSPRNDDPSPPRRSERIRKSTRLPDFAYSSYSPSFTSFLTSVHKISEPASYKEAVLDPSWQQAMADELDALSKTQTWDLVPLPRGKHAIGSRWVYKIKTKSDGSVERYKARLVAKGFSQQFGLDYEETFAPVAKMTTVRSLIAVASVRQWHISQMDVKNVFLHGDLTDEVYMTPPPGVPHKAGYVCKLKKSLYGLKQASRSWYDTFSDALISLGFRSSNNDSALFIKESSSGIILLSLYVDDMIITGSDTHGISLLKSDLATRFEMKDLGPLRYFLGIEVCWSPKGYLLSQSKYVGDILDRARLTDTRIVDTPMEANVHYTPTDGVPLEDPSLYRTIVGSLVYLTISRPDIAYPVHIVSQFVSSPTTTHWAAVVRILRYLRGTIFQSLLFSSTSSLVLRAFSDADWASDPVDRKSTTGVCVLLGDSLISWKSKKQQVVSRSSTEAEYRAMASTTTEIVWLRRLLADMGVPIHEPTPMYCDNKSAIQIAHNSVFHERTKHIEIDCHITRHHLQIGTLTLPFTTSSEQIADVLTKPLPLPRFRFLVGKLSMLLAVAPQV